MWYNYGMEIFKDPVAIATLVLALVTAILAITSFWIIQQNYKFREKDRKERLLNEIIQWAEGILLFGVGETVRENWAAYSDEQKTTKQSAMRKGFGFMDILDKGVKIRYVSSNIDATLESHVYSTMKLLQAHIDLWTQVKGNKITDWPQIVAQDKARLDDSARELIIKATALIFAG